MSGNEKLCHDFIYSFRLVESDFLFSGVNEISFSQENFPFICRKVNNTTEDVKVARAATPAQDQPQPKAKKQVSIEKKKKKPKENRGKLCRRGKSEEEEKERRILATRKFSRRSKLKRKRRRHDQLYFGPLVECK